MEYDIVLSLTHSNRLIVDIDEQF